jgi:hypothetical protein
MVGLVENALEEIKEKMNPDRIIIESRYAYLLFSQAKHANIPSDSGTAYTRTRTQGIQAGWSSDRHRLCQFQGI